MNPANTWKPGIEYAALSDVGLRRMNNQDSMSAVVANDATRWRERGHVFLVADGMGAHAAGELASKMSADTIPHAYLKLVQQPPAEALRRAIEEANSVIHSRGQANLDFRGMGTTTSVLVLFPDGALVGHVGDSRVYRLRGAAYEQLTFDHSLVWEMRASGMLTDGPMAQLVPKNVITRSLGPNEKVEVDIEGPFPLMPGDTFLLCSDGLSGQIDDAEMGAILATLPPAAAARALIDISNLRGGPDNITVLIVRVDKVASEGGATFQHMKLPRAEVFTLGWIVCGVLALVTVLMAMINPWVASVSGAALVISALGLWISRAGQGGNSSSTSTAPHGEGPYRMASAVPTRQVLDRFVEVAKQLGDAIKAKQWAADHDAIARMFDAANSASDEGRLHDAVRLNCEVISFMMAALREQRVKRDPAETPHPDKT